MASSAIDRLSDFIRRGLGSAANRESVTAETRSTLDALFGERYHSKSARDFRVSFMSSEDNVSFAGFIHPDSPSSGVYGGMSLIWFPVATGEEHPPSSLLTFVCGTRGLAPDEQILGRPGHARYLQALRRYLNERHGVPVWTKYDPTNLAQPIPETVRREYPHFGPVFSRYGNYVYAAAEVPQDAARARAVVTAFLDYYAWERGWTPLKAAGQEVEQLKNDLRTFLFPRTKQGDLYDLLRERRFVILQGPPGTGKTRLATKLLEERFGGHGMVVQFHPAVTYETFVAGISPAVTEQHLRFQIKPGWLVEAVRAASSREWLLMIDEINRADLGRVLGEAIYLFEPREIAEGKGRKVELPQGLPDGTAQLAIPENLYILGTMNSADRSIAILDLAVRRRFAFVDVWPDLDVVAAQDLNLATEAFGRLQDIFAQYAPPDSLVLLPGHAYFLASSEQELKRRLRFELVPLLHEYLQDGRLGACESELRAYLDWLEGAL